ncbi:hypothetical protein TNIN_211331 [Trichonephila inaurata madagascariensis]|uniref:Uncharacterized protein n=1 Tax=Trichonephila inaurata madagascariensis TaxID=2747483 RepID=A0A8X6Y0U8_9ARAC|nr:hypothetical protein TNIN_211331 [Trichonephila inaurata madagascariensis]
MCVLSRDPNGVGVGEVQTVGWIRIARSSRTRAQSAGNRERYIYIFLFVLFSGAIRGASDCYLPPLTSAPRGPLLMAGRPKNTPHRKMELEVDFSLREM